MKGECELDSFDQDTEHRWLVFVKTEIKLMVPKKKGGGREFCEMLGD